MNPAEFLPLDRRAFIRNSIASLASAYAVTQPGLAATTDRRSDLIARENAKPGDDWQLTRVRLDKDVRGYRSPWIEGYCSQQSVAAGETQKVMVSTEPARPFTLELFRLGYYGGMGGRKVATYGPLQGETQPMPEVGPRRERECKWEPALGITIPDDWLSGVYFGRLTTVPGNKYEPYWQSSIIFIVRDRRPAEVLFQCSDNTWQAYNRWPDAYSLYSNPAGVQKSGVDVSFDRPYAQYRQMEMMGPPTSLGSGEFLYWEFPLCYWLEQHGYDVSYCSNSDMLTPTRALACRTFLSVGHDEYWDQRQYQAVQQIIAAGVNVLFLSGNSVCYVSPFTDSSDGRPNRRISRGGRYGGLNAAEEAVGMGPFPINDAPNENLLIGARTTIPFDGCGDWVVTQPEHWMFEGTGMRRGDFVPGLVGWEWHSDPADIPSLKVVAEGMVHSRTGLWERTPWRDKVSGPARQRLIEKEDADKSGGLTPARWTATIYDGPRGNFVFNASTCWWTQGLSAPPGHIIAWDHWCRPHGPDRRVMRITENLLQRGIRPRT